MASEKRLIDANDVYLLFDINGFARVHVSDIDLIPRVDAVEVVRCKDCRHWDEYHEGSLDGPGTGMGVCLEGSNWIDGKRADDFCSYGERKDNV